MPYQPILGTLGYVLSPDRTQTLLIHRNARPDDEHLGKYNGLGGKLDPHESVTEGMKRELMEEAGITVTSMSLRGTISWPGFGKNGEDWFGFIFLIDGFTGAVYDKNVEGTLSWEPVTRLLSGELPVWEGDKYFMPLVFDDDPRAFHGVMPYAEGRPVGWRYDRL
jgi:8-oxo-dGTP diphosphatase